MDISHITKLLSSLGQNQVTIPIITNDFIETKVDGFYSSILKCDVFDLLDDMNKEIYKHKGNKGRHVNLSKSNKLSQNHDSTVVTKPDTIQTSFERESPKNTYSNIIHVLACVNDNLLMFERNSEKIISFVTSYMRNLINFVNNLNMKSLMIDDKKITKSLIVQQLSSISDDISCINNNDIQNMLISLSSKYLMKHIILMNKNMDIIFSHFDYTNNDIEDVILISVNDNNTEYLLNDVVKVDVYKEDYVKTNINDIKKQDNYKENLKSLCVKDLRNIAKKLCIDIVDTHTDKLYSKVDLRLLIEAKLNSI